MTDTALPPASAPGHDPLVSVQALRALLDQSPASVVLLDATVDLHAPHHDGDYRADSGLPGFLAGHLPGARHADLLGELSDARAAYSFAHASLDQLRGALQRLGLGPQQQAIVYDRSDGFWAARLWWQLRGAGISARVLDGGQRAWKAAGLPLITGPAAPPALVAPLDLKARADHWLTLQDVEDWLAGRRDATLVCALAPAAFDGSAPTRYARPGHIPGSTNLPARQLFDANGRYLRAEALQQALAGLPDDPDAPLWLYCGGGISAASLALGLTLAGRCRLAMYDGSLQEWAADPALPLVAPGRPPP